MGEALSAFLDAVDLDELAEARQYVGELTPDEQEEVLAIVRKVEPAQAMANLLMYPELIPRFRRGRALLDGLYERVTVYHILAAVVGLQRVAREELADDEHDAIVDRLAELVAVANGVMAQRASVTLDGLVAQNDADRIVGLLDQNDPIVKHNILVALIHAVGLEQIRPYLHAARERGAISPDALAYGEEQFATVTELAPKDGDTERYELSDLSAPFLSYIPSLQETMAQ